MASLRVSLFGSDVITLGWIDLLRLLIGRSVQVGAVAIVVYGTPEHRRLDAAVRTQELPS